MGVMALVVVISVMNGFDTDLREKILGNHSHLLVESFAGIENYPEAIEEIEKHPGVVAAAPVHIGHALLRTSDVGLGEGIRVKGIEPDYEARVTDVQKNLILGSLEGLRSGGGDPGEAVDLTEMDRPLPGVVLGKELAKRLFQIDVYDRNLEAQTLGALLGERLKIISPLEEEGPLGTAMRTQTFQVAGIFDSGFYEYDSHYALIGLEASEYLFALDHGVRRIEVRLVNLDQAAEIAAGLFRPAPRALRSNVRHDDLDADERGVLHGFEDRKSGHVCHPGADRARRGVQYCQHVDYGRDGEDAGHWHPAFDRRQPPGHHGDIF